MKINSTHCAEHIQIYCQNSEDTRSAENIEYFGKIKHNTIPSGNCHRSSQRRVIQPE
jgi:cytidine deaminase